uniref:DsbA family protein n=1 Tax=Pararhizobium sp. IMCC3301 TaxID=3067904 RepID=UPI002741EAFB|nr:DsbA family protein [Pararhizobium sp. IMCC3301]
MQVLDFWFDFASTYSYPAVMRFSPLATALGVSVRWHPFLLGPVFQAQGLATSPFNAFPAKRAYLPRLCRGINPASERPSAQQHGSCD